MLIQSSFFPSEGALFCNSTQSVLNANLTFCFFTPECLPDLELNSRLHRLSHPCPQLVLTAGHFSANNCFHGSPIRHSLKSRFSLPCHLVCLLADFCSTYGIDTFSYTCAIVFSVRVGNVRSWWVDIGNSAILDEGKNNDLDTFTIYLIMNYFTHCMDISDVYISCVIIVCIQQWRSDFCWFHDVALVASTFPAYKWNGFWLSTIFSIKSALNSVI